MLIIYKGKSQRRIVGAYEWNSANNFTQEVKEVPLALELITSPFDEFATLEVEEKDKLEEFITGQVNVPMKKRTSKKIVEGD